MLRYEVGNLENNHLFLKLRRFSRLLIFIVNTYLYEK